jgi:CheY-like chemotaxis protein
MRDSGSMQDTSGVGKGDVAMLEGKVGCQTDISVETIFLIDDDEIYQYTTRKYIEFRNLAKKIMSFPDGEEALDYLQQNLTEPYELPDMILLDLSMPVMDGWEFLEEYIQIRPSFGKQVVLYIVSSSVDIRDIERARHFEAVTGFIVKPIDDTKLKQIFSP